MKRLLVLLLAGWLSACGYHLRGAGQPAVKMKKVYLEDASGMLVDQFREVLNLSSARIVKNSKEADLHVKVLHEKISRRSVSLNFSGRSNETELSYRLEFQLHDSGNKALPAGEPILLIREYFSDPQDILAKNNEERVIRNEMYQQAVRIILERASAQIRASAK